MLNVSAPAVETNGDWSSSVATVWSTMCSCESLSNHEDQGEDDGEGESENEDETEEGNEISCK